MNGKYVDENGNTIMAFSSSGGAILVPPGQTQDDMIHIDHDELKQIQTVPAPIAEADVQSQLNAIRAQLAALESQLSNTGTETQA